MDQRQLNAFTTRTIQAYDTGRTVPQADVTAIAILLLDCADKDSRHGYIRESETIYRPIKPHISLDNEANAQCPG
ncbi:hypothetical protein IWQ61_004672 [Dispira simplex]|nr:hypothetical protein IWQ61_004672 [Dispira simplex]